MPNTIGIYDDAGRAAGDPAPERGSRILLADDSADNVYLMRQYFLGVPVQLEVAENGAVAVEKFKARAYDGVLMDIEMPEVDGYAATRAIRDWERRDGRRPVPVIALTAHDLSRDHRALSQCGFTVSMMKPIERDRLLRLLADHLGQGPGRNVPAVHPAESLGAAYLNRRREEIAILRAAAARGDFRQIRDIGHKLKGSGPAYGMPSIGRLGMRLESASEDQNRGAVLEAVEELAALVK